MVELIGAQDDHETTVQHAKKALDYLQRLQKFWSTGGDNEV